MQIEKCMQRPCGVRADSREKKKKTTTTKKDHRKQWEIEKFKIYVKLTSADMTS